MSAIYAYTTFCIRSFLCVPNSHVHVCALQLDPYSIIYTRLFVIHSHQFYLHNMVVRNKRNFLVHCMWLLLQIFVKML